MATPPSGTGMQVASSVTAKAFLETLRKSGQNPEIVEQHAASLRFMLQKMGLTMDDDVSRITRRQLERLLRDLVDHTESQDLVAVNVGLLRRLLQYGEHPERFKFGPHVDMKRLPAKDRIRGFDEAILGYDMEDAVAEARRCWLCEDPKCVEACPARMSVPAYIQAVAERRFDAGQRIILATSPLNAVCGRACVRPCESVCLHSRLGGRPLAIAGIKRFLADRIDPVSLKLKPRPPTGRRVAVVGSGPAGLTAAYHLALMGHGVTIFEALSTPGGMLTVGIPPYRLPKDVVSREVDIVRRLGVEFTLNTSVGDGTGVEALFKEGYDAVFIGVGAHKHMRLNIPGEDLEGVIPALTLLRDVNMNREARLADRVAVIGGGDVAVDAVRAALRLGAKTAMVLYRRSRKEMPAQPDQVEEAEMEGVEFHFLVAPTSILGEDGRVAGVECIRMRLGAPDSSGRKRPEPIPSSEFSVEVGNVIPAIGEKPDLRLLSPNSGVEVTKWGTVVVDEETYRTTRLGVYAGGDAVHGPATLVQAVADGRKAAKSIDAYLRSLA